MKKTHHSPAYVMQIKRAWRIVVPVRGKLTPRICPETFETQAGAEAWLRSDEGAIAVEILRAGPGRSEPSVFASPAA